MRPRSAFDRRRLLLHGIEPPAGLDPISLHLGESRLAPRGLDLTPLSELSDPDGWTRYPTPGGTSELRAAYTGWLGRRFGVRRAVADGTVEIEPTPGTKQAVAMAIVLAVAERRDGDDPVVVMPNPSYPAYRAAAEAAGARPVFYTPESSGDVGPIKAAVRAARGRICAIVICNPGNPQGEILRRAALAEAAAQAAAVRALLLLDECYIDLASGRTPPGFLSLVEERRIEPAPFAVLHTLSKRSGAPGLRSGFLAGDPATVVSYAAHNRTCGVSTAAPVSAVAAALWADDDHVAEVRAALARNWDLADRFLAGMPCYRRAEGGFFLWLPVDDDEKAAIRLWRDQALSVMPGRYIASEGPDGRNPGAGHLRIALVHEETRMREALARLSRCVDHSGPSGAREKD
ncbi:aminotransferase class I/II-fold pyridoxal phosphate-dependent enzyme [Streptosporangium sp. NPDC051022]|uniref:aminotransferase class I/II-fold pyridoxal phosphate-dependent enzyme n=1 Tax=Streptosporangium sp. NPDC051022 TaxID=3155752 RepID=UPI00343C3DF3